MSKDDSFIKEDILISAKMNYVVTKYYPTSSNLNNGTLELLYNLHNKNKDDGIYYVNLCNKVYNSDVTTSACLFGYSSDKLMFMGNYIPKKYSGVIDKIIVKISDNDEKILQKYTELILHVKRDLTNCKERISKSFDKKFLQLTLTTDNVKSIESFYGDHIYCSVLGEEIIVVNTHKDYDKNKDTNNTDINVELVNFCRKIKMLTSKDQIINFLTLFQSDIETISFKNIPLLKLIQSLNGNSDDKKNFVVQIKENNLTKVFPYCAYKYIWKILEESEVSTEEALESLEMITSEKSSDYWIDVDKFDMIKSELELIDKSNYSNHNFENYKNKKRKLEYLLESDYGY